MKSKQPTATSTPSSKPNVRQPTSSAADIRFEFNLLIPVLLRIPAEKIFEGEIVIDDKNII